MKTNIIAEIGINHDGKFKKAIKLIDLAKKAGADIVKFQIFEPDLMVTSYADKAAYQKNQPTYFQLYHAIHVLVHSMNCMYSILL